MAVLAPTSIALKNILFATDFSKCSRTALPFALALARHYDGKIFAAHIVPPEARLPIPDDPLPPEYDRNFHLAQEEMEQFVATSLKGVRNEGLVEMGDFRTVLEGMIEQHHIDLIVTGTHGREGLKKLIMGSVAEAIFRQAPCPVLTVGPHVEEDVLFDGKLRRVLFATDFSAGSMHALPYALSLAQESGAPLTLLHMVHVDMPYIEAPDQIVPETEDQLMVETTARLRELVPAALQLNFPPQFIVEYGLAAEGILKVAEEQQVSIIVMGVHGGASYHASRHLPGAVAQKVVCHAHCPVMTVRG